MKAQVICIGDELLIGQTINTNLANIGKMLSDLGIFVDKSITIHDNVSDILETLNLFLEETELVVITGGLGPTKDDLTKNALTHYFDTELVIYPDVLEHVKQILERGGKKMAAINKDQAMLPKDALILKNNLGTASGMWFERNNKIVVSLPGVPYEMIDLMQKQVIPLLKKRFDLKGIYYQTAMVQGIPESTLTEIIELWEDEATEEGFHLAYLPSPGIIKLRLSSNRGEGDKKWIEKHFLALEKMLPEYVYGRNDETIFQKVGQLLRETGKTLSTVESCTGGGIANAFVLNAGASDYLKGGLITYSNELKMKLADVRKQTLKKFGAVSEEVAIEMAMGGRERMQSDYCVAVTGIAGPDGGTDEKPVGTVWIAVATERKIFTEHRLFDTERERNIIRTELTAVNLLRKVMLGII